MRSKLRSLVPLGSKIGHLTVKRKVSFLLHLRHFIPPVFSRKPPNVSDLVSDLGLEMSDLAARLKIGH